MSPMADGTYAIRELQALTGVQPRTLRHWIRSKLLPKPFGRGRAARYGESHVLRARVIQRLRTERLSLRAIQARIGSLSEEQLRALVPAEPRPTLADGKPAPTPAPTYPSVLWEVIALTDGLVLMVNSTRGPAVRRLAAEIYRYYGAPGAHSPP